MIDLTKPVAVIAATDGYIFGSALVDTPTLATFHPTLPRASAEVSRLAKAGFRNLRVLKFVDGKVTNLKE
jgi:hypothetical protein